LQASFDLILKQALRFNLKPDEMVKRVVIFSDMQFDQACPTRRTDHEVIKQKFADAGYVMPQVMYWNLRESLTHTKPVTKYEENVAMLSGFSGQMLKILMDGGFEGMTPIGAMLMALNNIPALDRLEIID
jgi:hypothetical protein